MSSSLNTNTQNKALYLFDRLPDEQSVKQINHIVDNNIIIMMVIIPTKHFVVKTIKEEIN